MARYDLSMRAGETTEQYYRRVAKVADQRLVRLEALAEKEGYSGVKSYAYRVAAEDALIWGAKNPQKPRFNIAPPKERSLLNEKISDMLRFLNAPTSQKSSIDRVYDNRIEKLNERYGTDFDWTTAKDFFESTDKQKAFDRFASKTAMKAVGLIQKLASADNLQAIADKSLRGVDRVVKDVAKQMLDARKYEIGKGLSAKERRRLRSML